MLREKRMLATKQPQHIICSSYRLREHFFKHFVARHERELTLDEIAHVIPDNNPIIDSSAPALSKVQGTMTNLKDNRSMSGDGVAGELLKHCQNEKLKRYVQALISRMWGSWECLKVWATSRLKPLYKNMGSVQSAAQYKGTHDKQCH